MTRGRKFDAPDYLYESGLARTIPSKDSYFLPGGDCERNSIKDAAFANGRLVFFDNVVYDDWTGLAAL
jgi:hypothetical protein